MESLDLSQLALIFAGSLTGAGLIAVGLWVFPALFADRPAGPRHNLDPSFLFDGDRLVDATVAAENLLQGAPAFLPEKQAVISLFQDRFPTLSYAMAHLAPGETEDLPAADESRMSIHLADINGMTRITLRGFLEDDSAAMNEAAAQEGTRRELAFLRSLVNASPHLMWAQDRQGRLTWANTSYLQLSDDQTDDASHPHQRWPDTPVFADLHLDGRDGRAITRRVALTRRSDAQTQWFDVTTSHQDGEVVHFAGDANAAALAEASKIKAMQTAARLFGNLSTGLAIFDQKRRLSMFNPSLTDLTRLKPDFLASRPTLDMFLDALRETRVLPEPKNYASWRDQFTALETAARAGTYCENWETIDGQTFRVTGRPYADNSFVFLFDDLTAEVALTRRFRTDIETGQAVMDTLSDAIAVFSANGTLLMSNKAYKALWDSDHNGSMHSHQLRGEIVTWQRRCAAAPSWSDLRSFITSPEKPEAWMDRLILEDGRNVLCEARGITRWSTMIRFHVDAGRRKNPVLQKLAQRDPSIQTLKG